MEICGFLQGRNSKQFQSSDEIGLALGVSLLVFGFLSLSSMSGHLTFRNELLLAGGSFLLCSLFARFDGRGQDIDGLIGRFWQSRQLCRKS